MKITGEMTVRYNGDLPDVISKDWKSQWKEYGKLSPKQKKERIEWAKKLLDLMPDETPKEKSDPRVKQVISSFVEVCQDIRGFKPEINWGVDTRMVKSKLQNYTPEQLRDLFKWYLGHEHCEKLGASLKTTLSTYVINRWLNDNRSGISI